MKDQKMVAINDKAKKKLLLIASAAKINGEPIRQQNTLLEKMIEDEYAKRFG